MFSRLCCQAGQSAIVMCILLHEPRFFIVAHFAVDRGRQQALNKRGRALRKQVNQALLIKVLTILIRIVKIVSLRRYANETLTKNIY